MPLDKINCNQLTSENLHFILMVYKHTKSIMGKVYNTVPSFKHHTEGIQSTLQKQGECALKAIREENQTVWCLFLFIFSSRIGADQMYSCAGEALTKSRSESI